MKSLKSTTALLMCLSLATPLPAVAQGQGKGQAKQIARDIGLELCSDDDALPCVTDEGAVLLEADPAGLEICVEDGSLPCATPQGLVQADPMSDMVLNAIMESSATAGAEAPAEAEPEAEPETPAAEAEETPAPETAEAEEVVTEEAPAEESAAVEEAPAEEAPAEEAPAAEAPAEEAAVAEEAPAEETTAEETATEEAPAEETAEAEPVTTIEQDTTAETETVADADAQPEQETVIVETAPVAAAAAAEGDATDTANVEVETEAVTEDTARSASEEFETTATGNATATADAGGKSGLSNFEKALLLGLGAVAVGSILNNGDEVVSNSGDRVVLRDDNGDLRVLKDDDALLRQPGNEVRTETFADGSTRTSVTRPDGTRVITIRASDGRVVRRARVFADGTQTVLFDDTEVSAPVDVSKLPEVTRRTLNVDMADEDALRRALAEAEDRDLGRRFSLRQIRQIKEVRELAPQIELDAVTFASGSAAIQPSQAEELASLGRAMVRIIDERPGEVFLIEGHTDAVGDASYNLALSDRRAETVALALSEYFDVPPENMITQGYGESQLKVLTLEAERANRRAVVRRITPLLASR
jgi:outer membrane protein OmpA-like peptidoglycan-associated protein